MASVESTQLQGAGRGVKGRADASTGIGQSGRRSSLSNRFARDAFIFGWANVVTLLLNGILSFLLPRYLTIEDFGYYRLFVLYASLAGVAHLGMLEGALVRWAENPEDRVGPEIKSTLGFLLVQHVALLAPLSVALIWLAGQKWIWMVLLLTAYILICNSSMLGQIALQARREFSRLSFFTVLTTAALFCFVLVLKVSGRLSARMAVVSFVAANLLSGVGIWRSALKSGAAPTRTFRAAFQLGLRNTEIGWKLLAANLLVTLTPSLDRFFVSGTFPIKEFAVYAFAGNALAIVYTVAISSARVVYPYLSGSTTQEARKRAYDLGRSVVLTMWAVSLWLYFPTAYLVQWILPKYLGSLPVVRLLMISSGFVAMIHILHANYFRVNLALNRFLAGSVVGLVGVSVTLAATRYSATLPSVAAAMIGGIVMWWIANEVLLSRELESSPLGWTGTFATWLLVGGLFLSACAIKWVWVGAIVYASACCVLLAIRLSRAVQFLVAHVRGFAWQAEEGS